MSAGLAYASPARPWSARTPHIEIASSKAQRAARPRVVYAAISVVSVFAIFAGQLMLSIVVAEGAYQIENLQSEQKELLRTQDALSEDFQLLESTQNLTTRAAAIGMTPNPSPFTINLDTGAVYSSPGIVDPTGCGASCNLIANSLLVDIAPTTAPVSPGAVAGGPVPAAPAEGTAVAPAAASPSGDALPSPVTH